jgi:type II secretory pathway pseudopilin PulG
MIYDKARKLKRELFFRIRDKYRLSTGFSMLEAVVVVGVLLALAVSGLFAYGPIVQNAKLAKLKSAASEVYTAATVYQVDGDPKTKPQDALDAWNASSTTIKVGFFDTKVIATPAMMAAEGEFVPSEGDDFCIQATDIEKPEIEAKSGDCPAPPAKEENPPGEVIPEPIPTVDPAILKNGNFSEGLKYWTPTVSPVPGAILPIVTDGEAVFASGNDRPATLTQTVSIPRNGITHLKYSYRLDKSNYNIGNIRVNVYDLAGTFLKEIKRTTVPVGTAVPTTLSTAELTEFAGRNIKLEFNYTSGGYADVKNAYIDNVSIENTKEVPGSPIDVKASVNVTDATISWGLPASGASSITSYTVTPYRNGSPLAEITTTGAPPSTSAVFRGITSGGDYTFTVTATNSIGKSAPSAPSEKYSSPAETLKNGDFSAGMTAWTPGGTAVGSVLPVVTNGEAVFSSGNTRPATLKQTVTIPSVGLTHLKYSYRVDKSSYNVGNLVVNVYDPAGKFIKEMKRTTIPVGTMVPATLSTAELTEFAGQDIKLEFNFSSGGYADVKNAYIDNVSIQTVNREPDAPTAVKISTADTDATVTWDAPLIGGSSITGYTVTPYRNGSPLPEMTTAGAPPATSVVFKGMTSGGTYTFKVAATNSLGTSTQSAPSDPFLKSTKSLENGDFSAGLTGWTPGAPIAGSILPVVTNGEAVFASGNTRPSTLRQTVTIPSSGSTSLKYTYRVDKSSYNVGNLLVNVYDPAGKLIKEMKRTTIPVGTLITATSTTVDLKEFAGQDIKVEFNFSSGGYADVKNAYIDNVAIVTS